jgi:acyl carrier protein
VESLRPKQGEVQGREVPPRQAILERVAARISESLAVAPGAVRPESRLLDDLKADSLDFLDMIFAFEDEFGVRLHEKTVDRLLRSDFDESRLTAEGYLPGEDVDRLSEWLPALERSEARYRISPQQVFGFVTVEALVLLIERELAGAG